MHTTAQAACGLLLGGTLSADGVPSIGRSKRGEGIVMMMLFAPTLLNPWRHWWTDPVSPLHQTTFPRLLIALFLGVLIGAERQWRQRAAGLRTNTLVCLGAAAFVDLGLTIAPNTTQVIAYIVSGVGFLGAGAIMKDGANVRGLNTAATLWCSAAVGACAGAGEMLDAVFVAVLLLCINSALRPFSRFIDRKSLAAFEAHTLYRIRVSCSSVNQHDVEDRIARVLAERSLTLREMLSEKDPETAEISLVVIIETHTKELTAVHEVVRLIRQVPGIDTVDLTIKDPDAE